MQTIMKTYEKLLRLQQSLKQEKSNFNAFGKYNYRSAEQILETVKPLLQKEKCVLLSSDEVKTVGEYNYIVSTLRLIDVESGDEISVTANAREDITAKGLCSSQMTGVSSSYAKKYALQNLFAIDNSKDADDEQISENIFKGQIENCHDNEELMQIWENLTAEQKKRLKPHFTKRKNEIS